MKNFGQKLSKRAASLFPQKVLRMNGHAILGLSITLQYLYSISAIQHRTKEYRKILRHSLKYMLNWQNFLQI